MFNQDIQGNVFFKKAGKKVNKGDLLVLKNDKAYPMKESKIKEFLIKLHLIKKRVKPVWKKNIIGIALEDSKKEYECIIQMSGEFNV